MKALIDELPPQDVWKKHTHGTSLYDYPIARHSISQSNPHMDRSHWTPESAFHNFYRLQSEGHADKLTNQGFKRQEAAVGSVSPDGDFSVVQSRASKVRGKLENLVGIRHGDMEDDPATESQLTFNPTKSMSVTRSLFKKVQRRLKGRRSVEIEKTDNEGQTEPSEKSKGKRRESEPKSDNDSILDEHDCDSDEWDWDVTLFLPVDEDEVVEDPQEQGGLVAELNRMKSNHWPQVH